MKNIQHWRLLTAYPYLVPISRLWLIECNLLIRLFRDVDCIMVDPLNVISFYRIIFLLIHPKNVLHLEQLLSCPCSHHSELYQNATFHRNAFYTVFDLRCINLWFILISNQLNPPESPLVCHRRIFKKNVSQGECLQSLLQYVWSF